MDLQFQPGGRLVTCVVSLSSPQPLLTVGSIAWWPLTYETPEKIYFISKNFIFVDISWGLPEVFDESIAGSKAADAEREEDPASGVGRLGGVLGELLADLTVDLISVGETDQERETERER